MGRDSHFPGPVMPPISAHRNAMEQMGSYLCNLSLNLQRLLPFIQRVGDLLQRENLLTNSRDRHLTNEMAIVIGKALEEVSRATGSISHFYSGLQIG
jgi:hypothetical protein